MWLEFGGPSFCLVREVRISKMQLSASVILFRAGLALLFLYEPAEQYLCIIQNNQLAVYPVTLSEAAADFGTLLRW